MAREHWQTKRRKETDRTRSMLPRGWNVSGPDSASWIPSGYAGAQGSMYEYRISGGFPKGRAEIWFFEPGKDTGRLLKVKDLPPSVPLTQLGPEARSEGSPARFVHLFAAADAAMAHWNALKGHFPNRGRKSMRRNAEPETIREAYERHVERAKELEAEGYEEEAREYRGMARQFKHDMDSGMYLPDDWWGYPPGYNRHGSGKGKSMRRNSGGGLRRARIGKFEGGLRIDDYIHSLTLDGGCDELGDVEGFGHYCVIPLDDADAVKDVEREAKGSGDGPLTTEEREFIRDTAGAILFTNSAGFVDVVYYDTKKELEDAWAKLEAEYEEYLEEYGEEEDY